MVKLGEVCKRVSEQILPTDSPDTEFTYIGLEHIESNTGNLSVINKENGNNIKSSKNKFQKSDILYGKLRPYLNKVWLADRDGICSTDIWVLRPIKNIANDYFISTFLKSKPVVGLLSSKTEGANLPRVKASYFDKLPIPLPPLPTQHKIVEILEEADNLRKLRKQADEKMKNLIPSLFVQMFGDPVKNPKGWEVKKLGEVCKFIYGDSLPDKKRNRGNIDVYGSNGVVGKHNTAITESEAIIIGRKGSVGEVNFSAKPCFPIDTTYFIDKRYTKQNLVWLFWLLKFLKLEKLSLIVGVPGLNRNDAYNSLMILPPLPLQQEFAKLIEEVESEKARQTESRKKLDELFNSLMQRAFTGELVA